MSRGRFTVNDTTKTSPVLEEEAFYLAKRSAKRRRLELKRERLSKDATQSVLEGT